MTGLHCNSPPVDGRPSRQRLSKMVATDWYRFDFDGLRYKHGGHLKHLECISLSCLHWEQDNLTQSQLLVMQSAIIRLAITRTACTICENCHMIILCWPYLHVTIELYTCRSTGCFTFCFLIGEMRWLSCKSTAKEVHLQIWPGPTKHFQPPSMTCCHVAVQVDKKKASN